MQIAGRWRLTHLTLSIVWMVDWMRVEAAELTWREEHDALVPFNLAEKVLLLVKVTRCYIACNRTHTCCS
jgi:hypothetical protein